MAPVPRAVCSILLLVHGVIGHTLAGVKSVGAQPSGTLESTQIIFDIECTAHSGSSCEDEVLIAPLGDDIEKYTDTYASTISLMPSGVPSTRDDFVAYVQRMDTQGGSGWSQDLKLQYMVKPSSWTSAGVLSVPSQFTADFASTAVKYDTTRRGATVNHVVLTVHSEDTKKYNDMFIASITAPNDDGFMVNVLRVDTFNHSQYGPGWGQDLKVNWLEPPNEASVVQGRTLLGNSKTVTVDGVTRATSKQVGVCFSKTFETPPLVFATVCDSSGSGTQKKVHLRSVRVVGECQGIRSECHGVRCERRPTAMEPTGVAQLDRARRRRRSRVDAAGRNVANPLLIRRQPNGSRRDWHVAQCAVQTHNDLLRKYVRIQQQRTDHPRNNAI
jgi:hypothetical protein